MRVRGGQPEAWWPQQEAGSSHPEPQAQSRENELQQANAVTSQGPPQGHTSSIKESPKTSHTGPPTGDQVFKHLRLWDTFFIQNTTIGVFQFSEYSSFPHGFFLSWSLGAVCV